MWLQAHYSVKGKYLQLQSSKISSFFCYKPQWRELNILASVIVYIWDCDDFTLSNSFQKL